MIRVDRRIGLALGVALLFGVRLPVNFYSPYQASSVIEIWKRWHITLSQFLRDYLYIPLGGNRRGKARQYLNLAITMVLGGLWHGASWNFAVWGALHGLFLGINHLWRGLCRQRGWQFDGFLGYLIARVLTFTAFAAAFVYFRAATLDGANQLLLSLGAGGGASEAWLAGVEQAWRNDVLGGIAAGLGSANLAALILATALAVALLLPNALQLVRGDRIGFELPVVPERGPFTGMRWQPGIAWGLGLGLLGWAIALSLTAVSPFLYFQF